MCHDERQLRHVYVIIVSNIQLKHHTKYETYGLTMQYNSKTLYQMFKNVCH